MKLIELTLKECKELEMASFQREQGKSKVKDLYDFFVKKGLVYLDKEIEKYNKWKVHN